MKARLHRTFGVRCTLSGAFVVAILIASSAGSSARAAENIVITAARTTASTISIYGWGFMPRSASAPPRVELGSVPGPLLDLAVATDATDAAITAALPAGLAAGTYRVFVQPGRWIDGGQNRAPFDPAQPVRNDSTSRSAPSGRWAP